jgi:hypothetical protein
MNMTDQPSDPGPSIPPAELPQAPSPPPHMEPLGYRSGRDERRQAPVAVQALVGFVISGATSAAFNFASGFLADGFSRNEITERVVVTLAIVFIPLILFGVLGRNMRRRGVWRAFLPGALAGWAIAFLVEGWCFVALLHL